MFWTQSHILFKLQCASIVVLLCAALWWKSKDGVVYCHERKCYLKQYSLCITFLIKQSCLKWKSQQLIAKMNKFSYGKQFNKLNKKILFNVTYTNFWIIFFLLSVSNAKNDWSIKNRVLNKFLTSLDAPQKPVIRINRDMVDGPIETFLIKNKIWTPSLVQKFRHTIEWKCAA